MHPVRVPPAARANFGLAEVMVVSAAGALLYLIFPPAAPPGLTPDGGAAILSFLDPANIAAVLAPLGGASFRCLYLASLVWSSALFGVSE